MVTLRQPLSFDECQQVRQWRNDPAVSPMLRTGSKTYEEQAAFYRDVIANPDQSDHRFYALEADGRFVGFGGLTYLQRVDGETEISLIMAPEARGRGLGGAAVEALIVEARRLGLTTMIGECYPEGATRFWVSQCLTRPTHLAWRWDLTAST